MAKHGSEIQRPLGENKYTARLDEKDADGRVIGG
jgi:hypothetical protein